MKNTPRDFFLHFGAFVALYSAAIALATLLFRMIDYAFPDPLYNSYYYSDPYSGPMRFAIASLIILVPIFLYLFRVIQREARLMPERYSLGIRRWLTYITLFVAGATIIGDLITLLYSFLGGEFATTFLLKVLVLFAITGVVFWYFLLDIRGYWQNREHSSKTVGVGVLGLTLIVIISGFVVMGSPRAQREIRLDQQQTQDLIGMQEQILFYWQLNDRLPTALSELENNVTGYTIPHPPEERNEYTYSVSSDLSFELCATFAHASKDYKDEYWYNKTGLLGATNWEYDAGRTCFARTIDPNLIQPIGKPMPQVDQVIP